MSKLMLRITNNSGLLKIITISYLSNNPRMPCHLTLVVLVTSSNAIISSQPSLPCLEPNQCYPTKANSLNPWMITLPSTSLVKPDPQSDSLSKSTRNNSHDCKNPTRNAVIVAWGRVLLWKKGLKRGYAYLVAMYLLNNRIRGFRCLR